MNANERRIYSVVRGASILRWWRTLALAALCTMGVARVANAADLRVMKTGLGEGSISASGIACGAGGSDCNETGLSGPVTLTVSVPAGSRFTAWGGDCASVVVTPPATPPCVVTMSAMRSVRANFEPTAPIPTITDFSPAGIEAHLNANPSIDTAAEFVAALPQEFRESWILMPRSESLQTGTASTPRILLASADATRVFTIGLEPHASYPASHPSAIEYMQWDASAENFRFHEIVLATIPAMGDVIEVGPPVVRRFPERTRGTDPVKEDDAKCFACHSTRNVRHGGGSTPGTTGLIPGSIPFKTKPNWDTYDSWGGMLAFNRDRIYRGTVEAAAFRRIFNLWTWQANEPVRAVLEQLRLQPAGVPTNHRIIRWDTGGENDGHIQLGFDPEGEAVTEEPQPVGSGPTVAYSFDRREGPTTGSSLVRREDVFVTLHHACQPTSDEGRAVELFDRLTGGRPATDPTTNALGAACPPRPLAPTAGPNPLRIADELVSHRVATGDVEIDVRPLALAIARGCIAVSGAGDIGSIQTITGVPAAALGFFDARNGMSFDQVYDDTRRRAQSLTRRKADIERTTLDRDADLHVYDPAPFDSTPIAATPDRVDGLIRAHGANTLGILGGTGGEDRSVQRLRQEVFRRQPPPGHKDETAMSGFYTDREDDSTDFTPDNTAPVALYRYFLEPLGVSVDKWSMGVRGRSRTYTFADIFSNYTSTFQTELQASLGLPAGASCASIMALADAQLASLPAAAAIPTYTDMQRIFNKGCIECHGGLGYPPYHTYGTSLDLSENENPAPGERRLWRSLRSARSMTAAPACPPSTPVCPVGTGTDPSNSFLYQRITDRGMLQHPYDPRRPYNLLDPDDPLSPDVADERCPNGLMPCEGPPLGKTDIETFRRWIIGGRPNTEGDPHIETVDGVHYDFQSAGEFILLRGEGLELQARQTAVTTATPVGPDPHTGLTSCVSVNTAVAMRAGLDRITYQPEIVDVPIEGEFVDVRRDERGNGDPTRLRLRIDGTAAELGPDGIALSSGGRITRTTVPDGIEINLPGGEAVVITPAWWDYYQIWYMNIEVRHARSTAGVMGAIAPGNWLPALSNGEFLGALPRDPSQRHRDLYETFADSWRVTAESSLFDYEPGLSPRAFVVEGWPVSKAQSCVAPPQPGGPVARPAPAPIERADAEGLCQAIIDPERRENCVQDVMATGEAGFASTYAATEALERRLMPAPPVLVSPADGARIPATHVELEWAPQAGTEAIDVVYRRCIWNADELYGFDRCIEVPVVVDSWVEALARWSAERPSLLLWLALLVLLLIAVPLIVRYRARGVIVVLLLAAILVALLLALSRVRVEAPRKATVAGLVPGTVYFWKVVAETTDGVVVESPTNRFEVAQ